MKRVITIAVLILSGTMLTAGQASVPPDRVTPTPRLTAEVDAAMNQGKDISSRSAGLRLTEKFPVENPGKRKALNEALNPLYRKSTKEELAAIEPDEQSVTTHATFLKGKNTGIIRLAADIGCTSQDGVISGEPKCTKYTMPGGGSSYSFREEDYRIFRLADINFSKNKFEALGVMTHGIMVDLGDVPVEDIALNSDGVKHVVKISPASDFGEAGAFAGKLEKGYKKGGFTYSSVLSAVQGHTYVLRSIAYRGVAPKSVLGIAYNELDFDERKDVIVAFRVVSLNEGQDLTLIWKRLQNKKAPKLKAPE